MTVTNYFSSVDSINYTIMVTTSTSSSSDAEEKPDAVLEGEGEPLQTPLTPQDPGFVGLLVQSIFEVGPREELD